MGRAQDVREPIIFEPILMQSDIMNIDSFYVVH